MPLGGLLSEMPPDFTIGDHAYCSDTYMELFRHVGERCSSISQTTNLQNCRIRQLVSAMLYAALLVTFQNSATVQHVFALSQNREGWYENNVAHFETH